MGNGMQKHTRDSNSNIAKGLSRRLTDKIPNHQKVFDKKSKWLVACLILNFQYSDAFAIDFRHGSDGRVREISSRLSDASLSLCQSVDLDGEISPCADDVTVVRKSRYNAWSNNGRIFLTSALVKNSNDDELAFAVAHEMMHCILNHSGSSVKNELEADYWAAKVMSRAGYDAFAARSVLSRFQVNRVLGFPFSMFTHPSNSRRMKAISGALVEEWVMNGEANYLRSENMAIGLIDSFHLKFEQVPIAFDGSLVASATP